MGKADAKIFGKPIIPPLVLILLLVAPLSLTPAAGQTTGPPPSEEEDSTRAKLRSIAKLESVVSLAELAGDPEDEVRAAVVARLERIGGEKAVPVLEGIFSREERVAGTGIGSGIRGDCLRALARGRSPAAGEALRRILKGWIEAGPVVKGSYSHIYDSQYHAVLLEGLAALESFPGPETAALLRSLSDDNASFYAIREQAQSSLLALETAEKGFRSPSEGTAFLLDRIQPAGVLIEDWWPEPGQKKPEAIREAAVERIVVAGGRTSIPPLLAFLGKTDAGDHPRRAAAARMLTSILSTEGKSLSAEQKRNDKEALAEAVAFLEDLPPGSGASPTVHEIFQSAAAAADHLQDGEIYSRLRKVREGIDFPGAWKAPPPAAGELGLAVPADSVFLPGLSSIVETPWGMLFTACYASPVEPEETVGFFEQTTHKKAEPRPVIIPVGPEDARWVISLEEAPPELAGLVVLGVEVLAADNGFEVRDLGEVTAKGRTMFRIIRLRR